MSLSKRRDDEDELSPLPPLDGEDDARDDAPIEDLDLEESDVSLDDTAMEDAALDPLDELSEDPGGVGDEPMDDLPLGDDEVMDEDGARGGDEASGDDPLDDAEIDTTEGHAGERDRGEEGPSRDDDDALDALPPLDDDPRGDDLADHHDGAEAISGDDDDLLPTPDSVHARRLRGCAVAMGAARGISRLLVVGDGVSTVSLDALDDPDAELSPLDAPGDQLFVSVAEGDGGTFLGAIDGVVLRKGRGERQWARVLEPREGDARGPVEVHSDGRTQWCFTRGGRLLRSDEGGRFEAVSVSDPVRAMAVDPRGGVLVATAKRTRGALWQSPDGTTWAEVALPEVEALAAVAGAGDTLVGVSSARLPGMVSVDGGRHWARWRCLLGATAVALVETDDGLSQVLFALHDEVRDRAVLGLAGVSAEGAPVAPRRLAVIDHALLPSGDADADPECRIDAIVPLDRAGRRIAVTTARGVVLVERGD